MIYDEHMTFNDTISMLLEIPARSWAMLATTRRGTDRQNRGALADVMLHAQPIVALDPRPGVIAAEMDAAMFHTPSLLTLLSWFNPLDKTGGNVTIAPASDAWYAGLAGVSVIVRALGGIPDGTPGRDHIQQYLSREQTLAKGRRQWGEEQR